MTRYPIHLSWSDEDELWIADVPDLRFCSAHGATPHDALAEVEIAIGAWIEAARASGVSIPSPSARPALA
jgi:predicted RNase H-like HicB family nuclease